MYIIIFLVFIFLIVLYCQHSYLKSKVENTQMILNDKIKEYNHNIEKNNYEHKRLLSSLQYDYSQKEERLHKLLEAKFPLKYLASAYADAVALVQLLLDSEGHIDTDFNKKLGRFLCGKFYLAFLEFTKLATYITTH